MLSTASATSQTHRAFVGELCLRALSRNELAAHETRVQLYELTQPFAFVSEDLGEIIAVPSGFVSDFGSVPWWALSLVDDDDPHLLFASIIHDWLYAETGDRKPETGKRLTRAQADAVLAEAMRASGAPEWKVALVFRAVRLGGGSHWTGGRGVNRQSRYVRPGFGLLCLVLISLWGCEVLVKDTMRSLRADLRGGENEEPASPTPISFRSAPPELRTLDEATERVIEGGPFMLVVPQEAQPTPRVTIHGGTPRCTK